MVSFARKQTKLSVIYSLQIRLEVLRKQHSKNVIILRINYHTDRHKIQSP